MLDLEQTLVKARSDRRPWTADIVRRMLDCIVDRFPASRSDWDAGNESWGVVSRPGQGIAYVCVKMPLVIVLSPFAEDVRDCARADGAVVFEVGDFDEHRYKVDKMLLESMFGKKLTSVVSYDDLSIQELWYATVS